MEDIIFTPTDFVAVLNQTLDYAYPSIVIEGEIANLRVSRNKWVYFDIKDDTASIKCFGTVYTLPGPLEDGLMVRVTAQPRLHPLYNFSLTVRSIVPVGEGSIKRASDLLLKKLTKEGLFDSSRKRPLPYAPTRIGLIASGQSAAYHDFIKILNARWGGVDVLHYEAQVQGELAIQSIIGGITALNELPSPPEVLIITRGGGSADDLATFSHELVVRAVAASRVPTLVAIGHEVDVSLAELAADKRASTPSNAAELLVPDKHQVVDSIRRQSTSLSDTVRALIREQEQQLKDRLRAMRSALAQAYYNSEQSFLRQRDLLEVLNPEAALRRGYAIVRSNAGAVNSVKKLAKNDKISIKFHDGTARANITSSTDV
ncbi:MAG: exodeoxyribonuclease VII large subunit [Candidatus Saccharimonadales bacterium]